MDVEHEEKLDTFLESFPGKQGIKRRKEKLLALFFPFYIGDNPGWNKPEGRE